MKSKLKLDLHTHPFEYAGILSSSLGPEHHIINDIVATIKAKGLDGIAITEHLNKQFGFKAKEIASQYFKNEVIIIPGEESDFGYGHVVTLYLDDSVVFRFLAHPHPSPISEDSFYYEDIANSIHGIEIGNWVRDWQIDKERVKAFAKKHDLLLLSNSDAHEVADIGCYYNEIDLKELYSRATRF